MVWRLYLQYICRGLSIEWVTRFWMVVSLAKTSKVAIGPGGSSVPPPRALHSVDEITWKISRVSSRKEAQPRAVTRPQRHPSARPVLRAASISWESSSGDSAWADSAILAVLACCNVCCKILSWINDGFTLSTFYWHLLERRKWLWRPWRHQTVDKL